MVPTHLIRCCFIRDFLFILVKISKTTFDLFFSIFIFIDGHLGLRYYLLKFIIVSITHLSQKSIDHLSTLLFRVVFTSPFRTQMFTYSRCMSQVFKRKIVIESGLLIERSHRLSLSHVSPPSFLLFALVLNYIFSFKFYVTVLSFYSIILIFKTELNIRMTL